MTSRNDFSDAPIVRPPRKIAPERYRDRLDELFQAWGAVMGRNRVLSLYYRMHNSLKDLGISIPENLLDVNCTVGWCEKAVKTRATRSTFDGFVFNGATDGSLNELVSANRMRTLYDKAVRSTLVHGLSAFTVMRGQGGQPAVKVRAYSGTQFSVLWDKDADRIACGIVLADVDKDGSPTKYVAHFVDAVLTFERSGAEWSCEAEPNPMGRPMMEVLAFDPDLDRPLGHSMLTPEVLGIVDKAMRDVLRMEVGAEFFTFPQRYVIGAAEDLFSTAPEGCERNEDGEYVDSQGNVIQPVVSEVAKFKAYIGAIMAISRDENGDAPTVGAVHAVERRQLHPHVRERRAAIQRRDRRAARPARRDVEHLHELGGAWRGEQPADYQRRGDEPPIRGDDGRGRPHDAGRPVWASDGAASAREARGERGVRRPVHADNLGPRRRVDEARRGGPLNHRNARLLREHRPRPGDDRPPRGGEAPERRDSLAQPNRRGDAAGR